MSDKISPEVMMTQFRVTISCHWATVNEDPLVWNTPIIEFNHTEGSSCQWPIQLSGIGMWTYNRRYETGVLGPNNGVDKFTITRYLVQAGADTLNLVIGHVTLLAFRGIIERATYHFVIWFICLSGNQYSDKLLFPEPDEHIRWHPNFRRKFITKHYCHKYGKLVGNVALATFDDFN